MFSRADAEFVVAPRPAAPIRKGRSEAVRYVSIGVLSAALDLGALHAGYRVAGLPIWIAASAGFWMSFVCNFLANKFWTFGVINRSTSQLVKFSILVFGNFFATLFLLYGLQLAGMHYLLAKLLSVAILAFTTFFLLRNWVFVNDRF